MRAIALAFCAEQRIKQIFHAAYASTAYSLSMSRIPAHSNNCDTDTCRMRCSSEVKLRSIRLSPSTQRSFFKLPPLLHSGSPNFARACSRVMV